MSFYWRIIATDEYVHQVSELDVKIQDKIHNNWIDVAKHPNPKDVGSTDTCSRNSNYVVAIFPGLIFEFVYKIDNSEKTIHLLNCDKLMFLDHGQPDLY